MKLPLDAPASVPRGRRDAAIERLLFVGWWSLMALLPLGHLTGLRNTWSVVVVGGTLLWVRRDAWRGLPAGTFLVLLLLWCAASIGWSTTPSISFGKWQTDLLIPLLGYAAAFAYARRVGSAAALLGGVFTGISILALLSLIGYLPPAAMFALSNAITFENFPNLVAPLPVWYPGVGDASMAASLAAAALVGAPRLLPHVPRAWWVCGWIVIAIVVLASNNRNAALAIPVVVIAVSVLLRRRGDQRGDAIGGLGRKRWSAIILFVIVLATALVAMLEFGARDRLRVIGEPVGAHESALIALTERDTRPMIWAYYARLLVKAPIVGVGFGRTVPGIHYHTQDDRSLARVEFNAYIHAHNLLLNWWLQTGVIGVGLLIAVLVVIVMKCRHLAGRAATAQPYAALMALYALIALMLIRDTTDDFLVYGMATLFWTLLGCLAGLIGRPFTSGQDGASVSS